MHIFEQHGYVFELSAGLLVMRFFYIIIIFITGYPCHRSVGPAGDSVNPHPNSPVTEAGPRYLFFLIFFLGRVYEGEMVLFPNFIYFQKWIDGLFKAL